MSVLTTDKRLLQETPVKLAGTSPTTIVDGKRNGALIENIRIVNVGSGTPTVTVDVFDGTNAFVLHQAFLFAAAGTAASVLEINQQQWIPGDWVLRATRTGGSANDLHCFALYGANTPGTQ